MNRPWGWRRHASSPPRSGPPIRDAGPAFTLTELILVLVIIAIIAAIAVPRMSAASQTAEVNALKQSITVVTRAMGVYMAEHGQYPGKNPSTGLLSGPIFVSQLTQYSDANGRSNSAFGSPYLYGPYLRTPFPYNSRTGLNTVAVIDNPGSTAPAKGTTGWVAIYTTGDFGANQAGTGTLDIGDIQAGVKGISAD